MTDLTPPQDPQGPQEPQAPQQPESPQPNMFIGPTMFERQPMTNAYARPTFANDPAWAAKVQLEKDQNDTQVMMRIRQAIKDGDHDAVAEADRLQLKTGLSMRSIRENAGDARSIAAALDARDAGYAESNPALFRSINDPKFAAIAADDLDNLSWYERLGKGIDRGQLMVEQGNLGWKLMRDKKLSDADTARLDEITDEMDAFSIDEGWVALTGETLGLMGDTMPTALGAGALAGTAVGLIPGGQPFAMPAFMLASGGVGYSQMAAIEGGLAFIQYRKGGMDLETATTNATIVGRLNGMIELLPLGVVGKPFVSAGKAVARSSVRAVSRDGLSGAVRRMMAKRTSRRSIGKTAQRWALGTASEVTAEVGQELVTAFHEKLGMADTGVLRNAQVGKVAGDFHMPGGGTIRTHEDGTVSVTPAIFDYVNNIIPIGSAGHADDEEMHKLKPAEAEQLINELDRLYPLESVLNDETLMDDVIGLMGDTAWSALKGMWVIGGGGPMLQHMSERAQVKQSKLDHETLAETVGKAKASKTNKRAPSMFARFWQAQAEEGDDAVLVSRKDLDEKMTEAGIGIDELDKIFPGVKDQYELDADVQPDIVIPKGEAVSKFENNELFDLFKDVLRPNRDALSSRQLGALEKEVAAKSEDLRKQLDEDGAVVDARDLELDAIEEQIKQQLITAGTKPREASVQAAWARTVVGLRALRKSKTEGRAVMPSEISRPETISAQEDERRRSEQAGKPITAEARPLRTMLRDADETPEQHQLARDYVSATEADAKALTRRDKAFADSDRKIELARESGDDTAMAGAAFQLARRAREHGDASRQEQAAAELTELAARGYVVDEDASGGSAVIDEGDQRDAPELLEAMGVDPELYEITSWVEADGKRTVRLVVERPVIRKDGVVVQTGKVSILETAEQSPDADTDGTLHQDAVEQPAALAEFMGESKVVDESGQPLLVFHGTSSTTYKEGTATQGDPAAKAELAEIGAKYGITREIAYNLEKWLLIDFEPNGAPVLKEDAVRARELHVASQSTSTRGSEALDFDTFDQPSGPELGVHFGTQGQADTFGTTFGFYLRIENPLDLPDLGVWHPKDVLDAAQRAGVEFAEGEIEAVGHMVASKPTKNAAVRELLKSKGYDGVRYENKSEGDGYSYIIFDENQAKSEENVGTFSLDTGNIFHAKQDGVVRGQFDPLSMTIILGKDHNATTFFHEWSHFHLQTLMNDFATGQASAEDIADLNAIAKWSGHTDAATLAKASPATVRAAHEAWAASFERYLYTNSADSAEMRTTMRRIAEFFVEAWRQIKRINQNYKRIYGEDLPALNTEVRAVMDRMMLSDDQINTRLQQDAVAKMLDGVEVSPEEQVILDSLYFDHENKSKEDMRRHFVKQIRRLRSFRSRELVKLQKDSRKARTAAEEQAREDLLREKPEARLVHWLETGEIIEFNAEGEMVVREALTEPARIATTDPRVPKKYRALSPELAEDMQVDAEIELIEAEEVRDEQKTLTDKRLDELKASLKSDRELRNAVKKEQTIARKTQNKELIEQNDEVIENAEARIANTLESIQNAKAEQADWNRLVKQEKANVNKAKANTMKATDPARALDDGVDITFLVLKFGLDSSEQLIEGVQFDLTEEMHRAADKTMEEESPELSSPEAIQATVSEAVNNEALLRVRSAELAIIDKQSPGQNVLLATAKAVAKRVVSALLVKQLATHDSDQPPQMGQRRRMATGLGRRFEAAAKNAERQARSARDAKNLAEMRAHQRTALQQRALAAEAYAQRDNLRKTTSRLNSVLRWTGAKREGQLGRAYGGETVETARMMLGLIGIGKGSRLDTDGKYDPVADSPVSDSQKAELTAALNEAKEVSRLVGGDYKNMAIGDLREFLQGVDGILNLGRRMRLVKKGDMTIVIEELAEELNLQADREGRAAPDDRQDTTGLLRSKLGGLNDKWQRMESLLYQMDGGKIGTLTKTIWQPIAEAVERLNEEEGNVLAEFKDLIRPLRDQVRGNRKLGEPITASVLVSQRDGKPFVFEQGKLGIIGAMLHAGSMSNLVRLLGGWKWAIEDEETGEMDVSIWHKQVQEWEDNGTITEADWKMVRSIWALYDKMLPAMKQAHFEATGHDMELTQRMDVVTKWGKIEGGYVPAARDPMKQKTRSVVREGNSILDAQREMPFVQRGMVKGRVKHNYEALDLDPLRQVEHFHKHLIFTHLAVPAQQLNATVYHDDVAGAIERLYPGFYQNHMKPWMETVTTQSSTLGQHQNIDGAASFWTALRRNTGSVAMMGNIRNALQNIGGVALAAARVKPRFLILAAYDYMSQPFAVRDEINAKSRMMRLRHAAGNNIYEVRDAINELTESSNLLIRNAEATRKFLAKHTYILQELTQKPLDRIVWLGAYKQAVDKGAKEKDAIREADSAVRTTQHDSTPISLASGEKGGPVQKMFSQFMGWFVMLSSLRGGDFHNMSKGNAMMLVMGPMITTLVIGEIVSEMLDDQEPEDEGWDKSAVRIAANSLFALPRAFGPIGSGVSTGLQTFIGSALGTAEGYQMRMPEPAGIALIGRAFREGRQWIESLQTGKDMGNTSVDFSEMLLGALGYPLGAVTNRIQAGVTDEDADLKGLIVGR